MSTPDIPEERRLVHTIYGVDALLAGASIEEALAEDARFDAELAEEAEQSREDAALDRRLKKAKLAQALAGAERSRDLLARARRRQRDSDDPDGSS